MKHIFIPSKENEYQPHLFTSTGMAALFAVIIISSVITLTGSLVIQKTNLLAAIQKAFLVDLTNEERTSRELGSLVVNEKLEQAAQLKADHMAEFGYFSHVSPDGTTPWEWFERVGYDYAHAGENLAINFVDTEAVNTAWMDSPGHRSNILRNSFTEIGIATANGIYEGRETTFVVQMFGNPRTETFAQAPQQPEGQVLSSEQTTESPPATDHEQQSTEETNTPSEIVESAEVSEITEQTNITETFTYNDAVDSSEYQPITLTSQESSTQEYTPTTNWLERIAVNPAHAGNILYVILLVFVIVALVVNVGIEFHHQHPKHVAHGLLMIILILGIITLHHNILGLSVGIV